MTLDETLYELIGRLEPDSDRIVASEHYRRWPAEAVEIFHQAGWIAEASDAAMAECSGCEESCFMPVTVRPPGADGRDARVQIDCDRRDDMGRISIPISRLKRWQVTGNQIAGWLASRLGLRAKPKGKKVGVAISIGIIQGKKRSGALALIPGRPPSLRVSDRMLPLSEAVFLQDGSLEIDRAAIIGLVDRPAPGTSKKKQTQELYEGWQKRYRALKRKHPGMSDVWYSRQITKTDLAAGRSAETIRKNMTR